MQRERNREQVAEAVRPLTGMSPTQLDTARSRFYLSASAKAQGASLDRSLVSAEAQERVASSREKPALQADLLASRQRYKELPLLSGEGHRPKRSIDVHPMIARWRSALRFVKLLLLVLACRLAAAETVQVKYHGPVALDSFACVVVRESSDVSRICYDAAERYLLIQLKTTYYHYCDADAATVRGLQAATSKRQYFEARIRGSASDGPFDCRTHPIPNKYRLKH